MLLHTYFHNGVPTVVNELTQLLGIYWIFRKRWQEEAKVHIVQGT